jgi:hypothetical protein
MLMYSHRVYVKLHEGHMKYVSYIVLQRLIRPKRVFDSFVLFNFFCVWVLE